MNKKKLAWSANSLACYVAMAILVLLVDNGTITDKLIVYYGITPLMIVCIVSIVIYFVIKD